MFVLMLFFGWGVSGLDPAAMVVSAATDISTGPGLVRQADLVEDYRRILDLDEPQTVLVRRILALAVARMMSDPEKAIVAAEDAVLEVLSPRQRAIFRNYRGRESELTIN